MSGSKMCAYYLQGKCIYGDTCMYPHAAANSPPPREGAAPRNVPRASAIQRCKFYNKGTCSKGRNCPFSHVGSMMPSSQSFGTTSPPHITIPPICIFFKQKKCGKGTACPYSHDLGYPASPSASVAKAPDRKVGRIKFLGGPSEKSPILLPSLEPEAKPQITQSLGGILVERDIDGCKVSFAPGPTVHAVDTIFESRLVVLANIPDSSSREDIFRIIPPAYQCKLLILDRKVTPLTARLEFSSAKQAVEASGYLHGIELLGLKVSARMDSARITADSASLRSTKVKVSWFKPSKIAWAHYAKYSRAQEEAERLQGKTFSGQKLSVVLQPKTRNQTESFSVEIKGLPLKFAENDLKRFCHASNITVGRRCSFEGPRSYADVEQLLRKYGILESVERAAENNKSRKLAVFAHYREWKDAEKACNALHMEPQSFLRYSHLMLENVHAIRYNVSQLRYTAIKSELVNLQRRQPIGCKLRIYNETEAETVCVRGYSSSAKSLASLKISLEVLIRGEALTRADKSIIWEDRFAAKEAQEPLLALARKNQCWIEFDTIHRKVRLFGSPNHCKRVRANALKTLEVAKQQRRIINLDSSALRGLLTGGLHHIEQLLGEGKSSLDIRRRQLTVEGSDATILQVEEHIQTMDQSYNSSSGPACPVCLGDPVNPTVLTCGHTYCTTCITQHLKVQSASRSPDCSCLFVEGKTSCEIPIPTDILRRLLTPEEEARVFKAVYLNYIHGRPKEFLYCPAADCPTVYRRAPGVLRCPSCLTKICSSCEVEYHDGISCAEYQEELRKELAVIERWKQELDVRPCPNCQTDLVKEGGCNHLMCIQCKRHICWVCMETFVDSKRSYIHMGDKHGGIWVDDLSLRGGSAGSTSTLAP